LGQSLASAATAEAALANASAIPPAIIQKALRIPLSPSSEGESLGSVKEPFDEEYMTVE
jgi:hypothetical protein